MTAQSVPGRTGPTPEQPTGPQERDETASQRADRNYEELVQESRVAQTGVQILFGFLLSLAFYDTFPVRSPLHGKVLIGALMCTVLSALCFTATVMAHRLHFREGAKERLVWLAHRMVIAGMLLFASGMGLALWLVLARLGSETFATAAAAGMAPAILVLWVLVPRWLIRGSPH